MATTVDFWFDPSCPYSYVTARWLREVTKVRPIEVCWRVMSLSVLNEGREVDPEGDTEGYLWFPARVCAAVQREHGHEALGRFYEALWTTGDEGQDWLAPFERALEAAGLPVALAGAGSSADYDGFLRASHAEGIGLIGDHVGTPIVATTGAEGGRVAFFGPVISQVPTGERAGRLWDGAVLVAGTPGFHELKGTPHEEPRLHD
ncbi:mycothiol-dependent nitroreductase Rv2466c family protein [Sinosporangium siamense]|uniref:DSBA oxidoreductase n=1 Tax=Sinosporangium siamense TaxID=1367973 RepID=A0A919V8R5_9ACTN|nr:disulfide bond formation protein DsbA [Sinosporangium siamense]GII96405.1 DSBA oxidoreductase [Sinosporangium siamense]